MFHFLSYQAFVRGVCVPDVGVVWPCQDKTRSASIGPQSKTKKGLRIGDPETHDLSRENKVPPFGCLCPQPRV